MAKQKPDDILVEIPDHKLPKLATLYEEKASWAPHMVSFVHMVIEWKKSVKYHDSITLFSPKNTWEKDGTIIAKITCTSNSEDLIVFTLDEQCDYLYQGLINSNLLNSNMSRKLFYGVHEKHVPAVKRFLKEKGFRVSSDIPCYIYTIPPEEAKNFAVECPPDVYVKKLEPSKARQMNEVWPHNFKGSEEYLASFIEMNGGYGVFLKSSDEMVAWIMRHCFGHLAMLQTEEEHKKKGYGSLVTRILSKKIAEEGFWPVGTILVNNEKSISMFEKLGFRNIGLCNFFIFE